MNGPLAEGRGFEPPKALTLPHFKCGAINRSATPPCPETSLQNNSRLSKLSKLLTDRRLVSSLLKSAYDVRSHIRDQDFGHLDTAVFLLVILQNGRHCPAYRQS